MSLMTHEAKWRLLVGAAPLVGVAFFVWAAAQGEAEVAHSSTARAILAVVAALGTAVAWWTFRQLRSPATVPVASAAQHAGIVALRGRARALPDAVPLISPDGELCLWFADGAEGSVRPFLLVDDSGECIVLPAGADVQGQGPVPSGAVGRDDARAPERLLRNGDRIQVVGRFVPASPESLALQADTAARVACAEASQAALRPGDPLPFRDLRSAAVAGAAFVAAPPLVRHGLALPAIVAPASGAPLAIRIGTDEAEGGVYGMLAVVDGLVMVVATSLVACSMFMRG